MKKSILFLSLIISFANSQIDLNKSQLSELKEISVQDHKKIFVLISSNNCKYCTKQKKMISSDEEIYLKIQEYDAFHINKDIEIESTIIVPVTPAIIIFNEKNEELDRYYGYQNLEEMHELLDSYIKTENEEEITEIIDDYIYVETYDVIDNNLSIEDDTFESYHTEVLDNYIPIKSDDLEIYHSEILDNYISIEK